MSYTHLNATERMQIFYCNRYGLSAREIGRRLGRSSSTISRELRRGRPMYSRHYDDHYAQHRALTHRHRARHHRRAGHARLVAHVHTRLQWGWSPQTIAGHLALSYPHRAAMRISAEQIYQWVFSDARNGGHLYRHLRRGHRRRRRQARLVQARRALPGRVGIEHRPALVAKRSRFGDWEGDTIEGRKGTGVIATYVERKSGYLLAIKLNSKHADELARQTQQAFRRLPKRLRQTLTYDNGREFAQFKQIERHTGLDIYFADPYAPWQRGCNENLNGLLRQYFPKGSDFTLISSKRLAQVVRTLNNRPRKRHAYRTPVEVLQRSKRGALAT